MRAGCRQSRTVDDSAVRGSPAPGRVTENDGHTIVVCRGSTGSVRYRRAMMLLPSCACMLSSAHARASSGRSGPGARTQTFARHGAVLTAAREGIRTAQEVAGASRASCRPVHEACSVTARVAAGLAGRLRRHRREEVFLARDAYSVTYRSRPARGHSVSRHVAAGTRDAVWSCPLAWCIDGRQLILV